MKSTYDCKANLKIKDKNFEIIDLNKLPSSANINRLPFCLKILLENLLRCEDGISVRKKDIEALLNWSPKAIPEDEISFTPARVILQDFTGVPSIVDLAAMRDAMKALGGDPEKINPLSPVDLVIDHSVMVDYYGDTSSFERNTAIEFKRNIERYAFLHWGQAAFQNFRVVPPGTGIVHQVNLEYLAPVVFTKKLSDGYLAYPDTLVGTDSHTTMINGLGVLGWGVGGIEAEAGMLGEPVSMLLPQVVGFELKGHLKEGVTATDLVLMVTQMLREKKVVGKWVEFFGEGLDYLSVADRATIGNMAPEYGATCGLFPIDQETLNYLKLSGRSDEQIELVEKYYKHQGMFREKGANPAEYSEVLSLDLKDVEPCIAGPKRPQDKILLKEAKKTVKKILDEVAAKKISKENKIEEKNSSAINEGAHILTDDPVEPHFDHRMANINNGSVVIAAITSCTNTSNPMVMLGAGLLAKAAREKGLNSKPWVKTSFAPGSQVVTDYLDKTGLMPHLEAIGFDLVGYGCTTCIGNSGPLPDDVSQAILKSNLAVSAVLSGNRNFEGRIHPEVTHAYLASPPLVIAYALAGTMNIDLTTEALGSDKDGKPVYLKDIWPSTKAIQEAMEYIEPAMFTKRYAHVFEGDHHWKSLEAAHSEYYNWNKDSTYVQHPPYFEGMGKTPPPLTDIKDARVLVKLGDSVTTDHISPAGAISPKSPAGQYLLSLGVPAEDFNSYGSRRGNHQVMVRGTFANIRLQNQLVPDTQGPMTVMQPKKDSDKPIFIFDAATEYKKMGTPLIVIAGKEYGSGSSRDWAAKGPALLGVKAVIAESFERIHRSNLIGMGILPLQFINDENADSLKLTGEEAYSIPLSDITPGKQIKVSVNGKEDITLLVRIDTPKELEYFKHGGILQYVLRRLQGK
jgi:aconitate hydratase